MRDYRCYEADLRSLKSRMIAEVAGYPSDNGHAFYPSGNWQYQKGCWILIYDVYATPGYQGSCISIIDKGWLNENFLKEGITKVTIGSHVGHGWTVARNFCKSITSTLRLWIYGKKENHIKKV